MYFPQFKSLQYFQLYEHLTMYEPISNLVISNIVISSATYFFETHCTDIQNTESINTCSRPALDEMIEIGQSYIE